MTANFHPMAQWPSTAQMTEPQLLTQEELEQQAFLASGYTMAQNHLEQWYPQFDQVGQLDWSEMACKSAVLHPYPQSWYEAGLVNDQRKQLEASWSSIPEYPDQRLSQTATERALFMTPPAQQTSSSSNYFPTFPGSPISELDFCSTPEMSHSSRWESDHEEMHSRSPYTAPDPHRTPKNESGDYFMQMRADVGFNDCDETLEMPDGSTRRTSNWLPVDSSAGFTIGCDSARGDYTDAPHIEEFRDIQSAFFNPVR